MNLLQDIINYVRRIVKTPSNTVISDSLIIDYINRFYVMDMDARIQLFDYKTRYAFETVPFVDQYNMPYYGIGPYASQGAGFGHPPIFPLQASPPNTIAPYPVYQNLMSPAYINGVEVPLTSNQGSFFRSWPNYLQPMSPIAVGNGGPAYTLQLPFTPALRGHIDPIGEIAHYNSGNTGNTVDPTIQPSSIFSGVYISTQDANANPILVRDSGQFLTTNQNIGLLTGDILLPGAWTATHNSVNYVTGAINVTFKAPVTANTPINAQIYYFAPGMPRSILYFNNMLLLRPPPISNYLVELTAYLSPASFFNSANAIPFGYMAEYIARGAARKILSDTGDVEQFQFYEPLFREQEQLVWKRSQRQITADRTNTIFSSPGGQSPGNNLGQGI